MNSENLKDYSKISFKIIFAKKDDTLCNNYRTKFYSNLVWQFISCPSLKRRLLYCTWFQGHIKLFWKKPNKSKPQGCEGKPNQNYMFFFSIWSYSDICSFISHNLETKLPKKLKQWICKGCVCCVTLCAEMELIKINDAVGQNKPPFLSPHLPPAFTNRPLYVYIMWIA